MVAMENAMAMLVTLMIMLPITAIVIAIIAYKVKENDEHRKYEQEEREYKLWCEMKYGKKY